MSAPTDARHTDPETGRTRLLRPAAWLIVAVGVLRTQADPDLWGHVRFGLDVLRDRRLTSVDPYSFTQDLPWINHEWLSELMMGLAYRAAGAYGLMFLKSVLATAIGWVIWRGVRHAADEWRWGAMAFVSLTAIPIVVTLRPQLWTLLLVAILCRQLANDGRARWWLPALFVVWANSHGGWLVGIGIVLAWTGSTMLSRRHGRLSLGLVALASIAATLVTPYGLELWRFMASTVRLSRPDILEWQPIAWGTLQGTFWIATVAFVVACWRRLGRPPLPSLAVIAMMAIASARVERLVPLFATTAVLLFAPQFPRRTAARSVVGARAMVDIGAVAAILVALVTRTSVLPRCIPTAGRMALDLVALRAIADTRPTGRMITPFNWGEAALWHVSPAARISIDGRRETLYSSRTIEEQAAIAAGSPNGLTALMELEPDYVWLPLPTGRRTASWLSEHGYRIDLDTGQSFVASRLDRPPVVQSRLPLTGCFPGP